MDWAIVIFGILLRTAQVCNAEALPSAQQTGRGADSPPNHRLTAASPQRFHHRLRTFRVAVQNLALRNPLQIPSHRRNASTAFNPPKAKEFESANSTCLWRAMFGITSRLHSGSASLKSGKFRTSSPARLPATPHESHG